MWSRLLQTCRPVPRLGDGKACSRGEEKPVQENVLKPDAAVTHSSATFPLPSKDLPQSCVPREGNAQHGLSGPVALWRAKPPGSPGPVCGCPAHPGAVAALPTPEPASTTLLAILGSLARLRCYPLLILSPKSPLCRHLLSSHAWRPLCAVQTVGTGTALLSSSPKTPAPQKDAPIGVLAVMTGKHGSPINGDGSGQDGSRMSR